MKLPTLKMGNDATMLALGIVAVVVVYYIGKQLLVGAAKVTGGVVSGNNALTQGTPYQGTGVLGTLGAGVNSASGGAFASIGGALGNGIYDLFNGSSTPAATQVNGATPLDSTDATDIYNADLGGYDFGLSEGW